MKFQKMGLLLIALSVVFPTEIFAKRTIGPVEEDQNTSSKKKVAKQNLSKIEKKKKRELGFVALQKKQFRRALIRQQKTGILKKESIEEVSNMGIFFPQNEHSGTGRNVHSGTGRNVHTGTGRSIHNYTITR